MEKSEDLLKELEIQKKVAYTAGLLQGDFAMHRMVESIVEGILVINEEARIVLLNKKMSKLTGYTQEEVMGEPMNILIPKNLREAHDYHLQRYFRNAKVRSMGIGLELVARRKDGTVFPVEISISYLDTEAGRLGIAFVVDISRRQEMITELKERNIELDAYAHTVAHDLNAPLAGVIGLSELLISAGDSFSKEEYKDALRKISSNAQKMMEVIREILVFSSIKKDKVRFQRVKMNELIKSVADRLLFQIDNSGTTLEVQENLHDANGVPIWLEEVWFNLISNAMKYGAEPPVIQIYSEKQEDGFVKFCVQDNGKGISTEKIEKISHFILDSIDSENGFGLGLSIVKRILDRLGGRLEIENNPEGGAKFSFYLKSSENM